MAAKAKTPDLEMVDAQLVSAEELRRYLEAELAEVEGKIADLRGTPAPALEQQHASLTARLKSLPILQRRLTQDKEQAEAAETLRQYEQHHGDLHGLYTQVAAHDAELEELAQMVEKVTKQRNRLLEQVQIHSGRRAKLQERINRLRLGEAVNEIRRKFPTIPKYM